jgi:hypothetical protein
MEKCNILKFSEPYDVDLRRHMEKCNIKFSDFRMLVKLIIKITISHNFKIH